MGTPGLRVGLQPLRSGAQKLLSRGSSKTCANNIAHGLGRSKRKYEEAMGPDAENAPADDAGLDGDEDARPV